MQRRARLGTSAWEKIISKYFLNILQPALYILFGNNHNYHFHRRHLHQTLLLAEKNLNSFSAISTTNTQYYQVFDIWKYQVLPKWNILNVEVKQTNSIFLSLVAFKLNSCFESFVFFWFYVLLALCYPFATFPQVFFLNLEMKDCPTECASCAKPPIYLIRTLEIIYGGKICPSALSLSRARARVVRSSPFIYRR